MGRDVLARKAWNCHLVVRGSPRQTLLILWYGARPSRRVSSCGTELAPPDASQGCPTWREEEEEEKGMRDRGATTRRGRRDQKARSEGPERGNPSGSLVSGPQTVNLSDGR